MKTQFSLLASLVILMAQPMMAMDSNRKRLPSDLSEVALAKTEAFREGRGREIIRVAELEVINARCNARLIRAAEQNNLDNAQKALASYANVNTRGYLNWTPLMEACACRSKMMSELLLAYGADISIQNDTHNNALEIAASRNSRSLCRLLITHATFDCPRPSPFERQQSIDLMFTFLLALKRVYPRLPKEIRYMILGATAYSREHVMNTAFGIHRSHPERIPFLPIATVQALINAGVIRQETAIAAIKAHNSARIIPLLDDARILGSPWELLDPERFEENFGAQIAQHTKWRLEQK